MPRSNHHPPRVPSLLPGGALISGTELQVRCLAVRIVTTQLCPRSTAFGNFPALTSLPSSSFSSPSPSLVLRIGAPSFPSQFSRMQHCHSSQCTSETSYCSPAGLITGVRPSLTHFVTGQILARVSVARGRWRWYDGIHDNCRIPSVSRSHIPSKAVCDAALHGACFVSPAGNPRGLSEMAWWSYSYSDSGWCRHKRSILLGASLRKGSQRLFQIYKLPLIGKYSHSAPGEA